VLSLNQRQPDPTVKLAGELTLLAHRGYAARYPENTRAALAAAVDAGARALEFDIQLSADKVPFLLHDADFARTGGDSRQIMDMDSAEVERIGVGEPVRFGSEFCEVRVPRLADVVNDLRGWSSVQSFVELKRHSIERFGVETVVSAVLAELQPVLDRCVLISFELAALEEARRQADCPVGWALREWSSAALAQVRRIQPEYLFCNINRLPPKSEPLWEGPWTWVVYEVVRPKVARDLAARGVGVVETMAIAELAAGLVALELE